MSKNEILNFIIAGGIGAFGNQLLYWSTILKSPQHRPKAWENGDIPGYMAPITLGYVVTGAGVGYYVGTELGSGLLALASGATWPQTIKWINDAKLLTKQLKAKLGGKEDPPS